MNTKPRRLPTVRPPSKKRKATATEEVSFDPSAREEYLTGFHKRKVARIKHAQEDAAKQAREEKIRARAEVCYFVIPGKPVGSVWGGIAAGPIIATEGSALKRYAN